MSVSHSEREDGMLPTPPPSAEDLRRINAWYGQYFGAVNEAREGGRLSPATATTYLLHSGNFVRWLESRFEPGIRARSAAARS
jgi:hypothetical protein